MYNLCSNGAYYASGSVNALMVQNVYDIMFYVFRRIRLCQKHKIEIVMR
jgi:hypothetical protein